MRKQIFTTHRLESPLTLVVGSIRRGKKMKQYKTQKRHYERLKMMLVLERRIEELEKGNEALLKELKKKVNNQIWFGLYLELLLFLLV